MKKSLIFIAMLALATTLFAENESVSCESELGQCTYTLFEESFSLECVCRDGSASGEDWTNGEDGSAEFTLPTEEECKAELDNICKGVGFKCENEAGYCNLSQDEHYSCVCFGVAGRKSGESDDLSAEGCTAVLEQECGTQVATPKMVCTDEEILNDCISYEQTFADTCFEPLTDEEIAVLLETSVKESGLAEDIANCCQNDRMRNVYKTKFECVEAAESCENKECCATCEIQLGYDSYDEGSDDGGNDLEEGDTDAANTEVPTDGAPKEDTADGDSAPATDSEAPAEKEESKSDGCSMLFV